VFEDSLFATNQHRSPQRGMAAFMSFGIQAVFLGLLLLIPLFYTDALPLTSLKSYVEIPVPPGRPQPPPPPDQARRPPQQHASNFADNQLVEPIVIPPTVTMLHESPSDVPAPPGPYVDNSIGGPVGRSPLMNQILASNIRPVAPPASIQPRSVRVSGGVIEGLLINRVTPVYPTLARNAHIQGSVVLHAIIGRDGTIQNLQAISGPPLLIPAALDAVQRWRYRPYLLTNEPVEVETQITVNFTLGG